MSRGAKAAIAVAMMLLFAGAAFAAVLLGLVPGISTGEVPDRVLIIATAPGPVGGEVALFAAVVDADLVAVPLDTDASATVPGTSADSPREAYAFGGGDAVAEALAPQVGGDALQWLLLSADDWRALVDASGGIPVDVPATLSAYVGGDLMVFDEGRMRVSSREAAGLTLAAVNLPDAERQSVAAQLREGFASIVASSSVAVRDIARSSTTRSSMSPDEIGAFFGDSAP